MTVALTPNENQVLARLLPELVRLSPAARIAAIHELVDSMQPVVAPAAAEVPAIPLKESLLDFAGVWDDKAEADIMEQAILESRHSEVKTSLENWD